jgi:uncharacterized protein YceK
MKYAVMLFALCSILFTSGCATIISHGARPVTITSQPDGAKLEIYDVSNNNLKIVSATTPNTTTLERGDGYFTKKHYSAKLTKTGYIPEELEIAPDFNGWYIGNLIFGGLIGMVVVDPATGDMWDYYTRQHIVALFPDTPKGKIDRDNNIKKLKKLKEEEDQKQQQGFGNPNNFNK